MTIYYYNATPEQKKELDHMAEMIRYYQNEGNNTFAATVWGDSRTIYLDVHNIEWGFTPPDKHVNPVKGTDVTMVKSTGKYAYIEPERDEQGTLYGYKVLRLEKRNGKMGFMSPQFRMWWIDGKATSDQIPSARHDHGLHFAKRPDHHEFEYWMDIANSQSRGILVRCALYGDSVAETEQGFRAHKALITHVFVGEYPNGYWQDYYDYSTGSRTDPRKASREANDTYQDYTDFYPYS